MAAVIYHTAYRLNPDSVSASAIRPIQMKQAFADAGYDVFDLTGTAKERRTKFKLLKAQVKAGRRFDFMYSESSTIPPMLGNPNHFPHPFLDAQIFAWLKRAGIPQSVFYRDIYWKFDDYVKRVGRPMAAAIRPFYKAELALYRRYMTRIYVPSLQMAAEVPELAGAPVDQLPPGGHNIEAAAPSHPVKLIYVGGIGQHYQLHQLVAAVKANLDFHLTICTDKARWDAVADEYDIASYPNIQVVHLRGAELIDIYREANVAVIVVNPSHYWGFAVPVKLFEYVNYGKPILVSQGTLAAQIVENNGWGWATENESEAVARKLRELSDRPSLIDDATARVVENRADHTWLARAKKVAADVTR